MKLSEAIRLGGVLSTEQLRGYSWNDEGGTCAGVGAFLAVGKLEVLKYDADPICAAYTFCSPGRQSVFPILSDAIANEIVHRNDALGQSRDEIADWVETLERAQEEEPISTPQEVPQCVSK